ncbi:hypothetical protein BGX27_000201 [Mortierella sp. AM989]|nr:hypothetical protein BGX27_000201 [Mortierella sp. AM989]
MRFFLGIVTIALSAVSVMAANSCSVGALAGTCISTTSCFASGGTSTAGHCPNDPNNVRCCTYGSCKAKDGRTGKCAPTGSCSGISIAGLCPGPANIQCCVSGGSTGGSSCTVGDGRTGKCISTSSCSGTSVPGFCPGASNIQCCVSGSPPKPPSGPFNAAAVIAAARKRLGVPYVWGGGHAGSPGPSIGTCVGYTGSIKPCPADRTVGLDCSGLVRDALYRGVGIDLGRGGNTNTQFADRHSRVVSYADRQPGDIEFFGPRGAIYHVILYIGKNSAGKDMMIEAQKTGTNVHEVPLRTGAPISGSSQSLAPNTLFHTTTHFIAGMFRDNGFLYLVKDEVVYITTAAKIIIMMFLTNMAILIYYSRRDWHGAVQISNGAGNIGSLFSSPRHRHGAVGGTVKAWILSTFILILAIAANYTSPILLLVWSPAQWDFSVPVSVDLSNTYLSLVPNDLYTQYTVNGSIMPDLVLDSRYNPVFKSANAAIEPNTLHGERILNFTIDYDAEAVLRNIASNQCSPSSNACIGITYVTNICFEDETHSSDFVNTTINVDISDCAIKSSTYGVPVMKYVMGTQSPDVMHMDVYSDDWHRAVMPESIGTDIRHRFRLSSIPYPGGRGLAYQYNMASYFLLNKTGKDDINGNFAWSPSVCAETLSKFHFVNTTQACSNVTIFASGKRLLINTHDTPNESTMRYCIVSSYDMHDILSLNCGVQHLTIAYLGVDVPYDKRGFETAYYVQSQGRGDVWCSDDEYKFRRCTYDDPDKPYRTISSRGYGTNFTSDISLREDFMPPSEVDFQTARIDAMVNLTYQIFLREYSIGLDKYILNGTAATGVGHLTMNRYRVSFATAVIVGSLAGIMLVSSLVVKFLVLPKHYTSSAFDVFRVATSPDSRRSNEPGKADQDMSLQFDNDGNITISNSGSTIGPLRDEYPLVSNYSPDSDQSYLLNT